MTRDDDEQSSAPCHWQKRKIEQIAQLETARWCLRHVPGGPGDIQIPEILWQCGKSESESARAVAAVRAPTLAVRARADAKQGRMRFGPLYTSGSQQGSGPRAGPDRADRSGPGPLTLSVVAPRLLANPASKAFLAWATAPVYRERYRSGSLGAADFDASWRRGEVRAHACSRPRPRWRPLAQCRGAEQRCRMLQWCDCVYA